MILKKLAFHNFGPFRGREVVELDHASDDEKPIFLFGALNGSGKTSLLQALLLVLYGARAPVTGRGRKGYHQYLLGCINNRVPPAEGAGLELEFDYPTALETFRVRVIRSWRATPKGASESVAVYRNGHLDRGWTDSWAERVEALIPLGISSLFFFDGEQVKELATREETPPDVQLAIRTLLGLELPERLDRDLDIVISRVEKRLVPDKDRQRIDALREACETIQTRLDTGKRERGEWLARLERVRRQVEDKKARFLADGGELAQQREELTLELGRTDERIATQRQSLMEIAGTELPYSLVTGLLARARERAATELAHEDGARLVGLLAARDRAISKTLAQQRVKKSVRDLVTSALAADRAEREGSLGGSPYLQATAEAVTQLSSLESSLATQVGKASDMLSALEQSIGRKRSLSTRQGSAAPPEVLREQLDDLGRLEGSLREAEREYAQSDRSVSEQEVLLEQSQKELKRQLRSVLELDRATTKDRRIIGAAERVHAVLAAFRNELQEKKLDQLEQEVARCFRYLLRKDDLVQRIEIDKNDFRLTLYDDESNAVEKSRLSAGEQQLLAISFLWGLSLSSGRSLPVVIDTPLGRMDSTHRKHLVERYFPHASHQVLLLSTDEEIDETYLDVLKANNALDRCYTISYDRESRGSKVRDGYFW